MAFAQTARTASNSERREERGARPLGLVLLFILVLVSLGLVENVRQNTRLLLAFLIAGAALSAWTALLLASTRRRGRTLTVEVVLRKQHYLQACAQATVLLYWGWYWPRVYDSVHLIAAQLAFAYAVDMLLCWSRRDVYVLGFGPFPIIFSINLFLWFREDYFFLQFLMVALGLAAKALIHWEKDGRQTHIFNPSSFPLAVFSLALILTGTSELTWGQDIAITQFYPPHMYVVLFLVGLPGQYFFGVTSMTMSAVLTTYLFGLAYFAVTGVYFFYDSYIPIAVFLGMHLLFTDPSTSPRTELGRIVFGVLYGLSSIALYSWLGRAGVPTFYDKLLQVPFLNLSIKLIDRAARSEVFRALDPASLGQSLAPRQRHLAYVAIWATAFVGLSAVQGVGDGHRGQWLPFWQQACHEQRPHACVYLARVQSIFCNAGSGWACNEAGILYDSLVRSGEAQQQIDRADTEAVFERGCQLGLPQACHNLAGIAAGVPTWERAQPSLDDYPIVLRGSKGVITDRTPSALLARACLQGWPNTCARP